MGLATQKICRQLCRQLSPRQNSKATYVYYFGQVLPKLAVP